jgi:hypothetical protein
METADVRKRVLETIDRSRRTARDRRVRIDAASEEFTTFLERIGIPLCRQVAGALKAAGYPFTVNTPGGAVRLASERSDDYIELSLDTEGDDAWVVGHSRRAWGRRVVESEGPVRRCPVRDITEDDVLTFLMKELEPFVER